MPYNYLSNNKEIAAMPQRVRDVLGRLKVTMHQNVYEADFEYGSQPLRWEALTAGSATVTPIPNQGGVRLRVTNAAGDVAIRQSRPYHRYQPGKTMFMATGCVFGAPAAGSIQRVGFFDDTNGVFWEQGVTTTTNPQGMWVVVRSDVGGTVQEFRVPLDQFNGDKALLAQMDFTKIQMFWIEYGWYGAGATRFGFWLNGEPIIAHQIGWGNFFNTATQTGQVSPWARTGNLPVRYEVRNTAAQTAATNDMYHWGVSVVVEGGRDEQRGFTYSYGMALATPLRTITANNPSTRSPVLSIRARALGTLEYGNILNTTSNTGAVITATATSSAVIQATVSGNILTIVSVTSGTVAANQAIVGFGLSSNTYIVSGSGQTAGSTWTLSSSQVAGVGTTTYTCNYTSVTVTGGSITANQYQGRLFYMAGVGSTGIPSTGRILTHTATVFYLADVVTSGLVNVNGGSIGTTTLASSTGATGGGNGVASLTLTTITGTPAIGMAISGTGIAAGTYLTAYAGGVAYLSKAMTAGASGAYTLTQGFAIGLSNRGQLLPKRLHIVQTAANVNCVIEMIASTTTSPVVLTGASYQALADLGSSYSFAERDVNATALSGGEVVFALILSPGAGVQDLDFTYFFAMYNNIRGTQLDSLTVAVSFPGSTAALIGASLTCQEAMS
jgi:hypothetical protein